ncbi:MAG: TIGR00282 family metallophosphoesterase [Alphaproteobacteria bacterium]|nr:TIGR00282 family metallophosphoesterase [Alphaproteobacteria bacterium]
MRGLFLGDVVGRAGREAVVAALPGLRTRLRLDWVVINAENAAGGSGLTPDIARALFDAGADALTLGNHGFAQRVLWPYLEREPRIVRPANYPPGAPGQGLTVLTLASGQQLVVLSLMGRLFMEPLDCPFRTADAALAPYRLDDGARLGSGVAGILVDIHAEATSEKMALGHYLDGRVTAVIGTHTHIPTADAHLLANGTAYQTDAGMCGDYDSVIGMRTNIALERLIQRVISARQEPAAGPVTLAGAVITHDPRTGLALSIQPFRQGGVLPPT